MRVGAHTALATGCQRSKFGHQAPFLIKQLFGPIAAQPVFQQLQMLRMLGRVQWHLMRTEVALARLTIDLLGPSPAFG